MILAGEGGELLRRYDHGVAGRGIVAVIAWRWRTIGAQCALGYGVVVCDTNEASLVFGPISLAFVAHGRTWQL